MMDVDFVCYDYIIFLVLNHSSEAEMKGRRKPALLSRKHWWGGDSCSSVALISPLTG